jgi:hypothetical protein
MDFKLCLVCIHDLFPAVGALKPQWTISRDAVAFNKIRREQRTIEVGFGGLTGRPFALTGTLVPAASAFLCSLWTWNSELVGNMRRCDIGSRLYLGFL